MKSSIALAALTSSCLALACLATAAQAQAPAYHVTKTVALGAPDRWDYLVYDNDANRLYVSHGDRLTVIDGRAGPAGVWARPKACGAAAMVSASSPPPAKAIPMTALPAKRWPSISRR